jgi:hypothetical protein
MRLPGLALLGALALAAPAAALADAPDTTITSGPPLYGTSLLNAFEFSSSVPGSSFECRVRPSAFVPCSSPFVVSLTKLNHDFFEARAHGPAGSVDQTPPARDWWIGSHFPPVVKILHMKAHKRRGAFTAIRGTTLGDLPTTRVQISMRVHGKYRPAPKGGLPAATRSQARVGDVCDNIDLRTGRTKPAYCGYPPWFDAKVRGGHWWLRISPQARRRIKPARYEIWVKAWNPLQDSSDLAKARVRITR